MPAEPGAPRRADRRADPRRPRRRHRRDPPRPRRRPHRRRSSSRPAGTATSRTRATATTRSGRCARSSQLPVHCHSGPAPQRGLRRGARLDERLRVRDDLLHRTSAVVHAAHRRVRALPDAARWRSPRPARFWVADMLWRMRHDGDARARHAQDGRTRAASSRCCRASTSTATVQIGASNTRRRELGRRYEIGVGNIMWGNDFPHPEGTWPYTREFLKDRFWDIPVDETAQILGLNQAEFYGFDLDRLRPIADRIGPTPRTSARPTPVPPPSGSRCAAPAAPGSRDRRPSLRSPTDIPPLNRPPSGHRPSPTARTTP